MTSLVITFVRPIYKLQPPPSFWAQVPSDARRTNSGPESFHRHFNAQFTSPHPTFFIFGDEIVKQQTVTYITMIYNISSCALSATAMLRYTIYRRVSETFTAECMVLPFYAYSLYCDLFVILVFYVQNVFCDSELFLCDFGCLRSS